ncbi:metallophosphoesterase [Halosimplex sp. TS25]|uniref:metallophosphoesterase n=1 Tax=Halosimplex rarum TaxID=3396619 RepID=UPI0039EA34D5
MITVLSDTHGTDGHRLEGRTLEAVRAADLVIHAGDFTTEAVLDAFESEAGADADGDGEFVAVYGNNDDAGTRGRLEAARTVEWAGFRFVVVHGHEHDDTALSLLGRQERADVVVVGHSHEPGRRAMGAVTVLNPGSHADPRWYRPAHAELDPTEEGLRGRLVAPDGEVYSEFDLPATGRE